METGSVRNNEQERRFELPLGEGQVAFVNYIDKDGVLDLVHTEVPDGFEGQGVGGKLIKGTFDLLQKEDRKISPSCAFVAAYLQRHPEYKSMLKS